MADIDPDPDPDLKAAYALETPADNQRLYAQWAQDYDQSFAAEMDYRMPQHVADAFAEVAAGRTPVLDVGAGTGLLGQALAAGGDHVMDALDISPQMLAVAMGKGVYRQAIEADLTQTLALADGSYGAVVSSGTFTHGHVGRQALDTLLRVARGSAVFVLAINKEFFEARGFADKFAQLEPDIDRLAFHSVPIYGAAATGDHKDDQALIAVFYKR